MSLQSMLLGTDKMPASERIERLESQVDYLKARVAALEALADLSRPSSPVAVQHAAPQPADPRPTHISARSALAFDCAVDPDTIRRKVNHDPAFKPLARTLHGVKISESDQAMTWLASPDPEHEYAHTRYYAITHGAYSCEDAMRWHMERKRG